MVALNFALQSEYHVCYVIHMKGAERVFGDAVFSVMPWMTVRNLEMIKESISSEPGAISSNKIVIITSIFKI